MAKSVSCAVSVAPVPPIEAAQLLEQLASRPLPPSALRVAMLALAAQLRGSTLVASASKLGAILGIHRNAVGEARRALVGSGAAHVEQSNPFSPIAVTIQAASAARSPVQHTARCGTSDAAFGLVNQDASAVPQPPLPVGIAANIHGADATTHSRIHNCTPKPAHAAAFAHCPAFAAPVARSLQTAGTSGTAVPPNVVAQSAPEAPKAVTPAPAHDAQIALPHVAPAARPKISPDEILKRMQAVRRRMSPSELASYDAAMIACNSGLFERDVDGSALSDEDLAYLATTIPSSPSRSKDDWKPVTQGAERSPVGSAGQKPAIAPEAIEAAKQEVLGAAARFKGLSAAAKVRIMTEAVWARAVGQIRSVGAVVALVGQGRWSRPRGMPDSFCCPDLIAASGDVAVGC